MKLKITDEKLNKFIQGYLDRGTEPTYSEVAEMVEIYYQFKIDKLISIIEMQSKSFKEIYADGSYKDIASEISMRTILEADKMLKELKGAE